MMSFTIGRLCKQCVVWVDDLIGQNVKPLSDHTLTLKKRQIFMTSTLDLMEARFCHRKKKKK